MVVNELLTVLGFKVDSSDAKKFNKTLEKTRKIMLGVTAVAGAVGTAVLKSAGDMEQTAVAFETMTGSIEKAQTLMNDIKDFAKRTPFELTGLIDSSKKLLAFGIEADEITDKLEYLGNIASGVGRDKLPTLILAFGKIRTKGKASMEELNMMLEAGVPVLDELAKQYGVTTKQLFKMVEKGEVGFNDVDKALRGLGTGSGKFANLMEKQSRTFLGIVSNIGDFVEQLRISIGERLLPEATAMAKAFLEFAEANREIIVTNVVKFLRRVAFAIGFLYRLIQFFLPYTVKWFGYSIDKVKELVKWFIEWKDILIPLSATLGSFLGTLLMVNKVSGATTGLITGFKTISAVLSANKITLIIAGIVALSTAIYFLWKNWDKVWNWLQEKTNGKAGEIVDHLKNLGTGVKDTWNNIKESVTGVIDNITSKYNAFKETTAEIIDGVKKKLRELSDFLGLTVSEESKKKTDEKIDKLKEFDEAVNIKANEIGANIVEGLKTGGKVIANLFTVDPEKSKARADATISALGGTPSTTNNNPVVNVTVTPPANSTGTPQDIGNAVASAIRSELNTVLRGANANARGGLR